MTSGCKWMYIKQKTLFAVLLNDNEVKGEKLFFFYNFVPTYTYNKIFVVYVYVEGSTQQCVLS